MVLVKVDRHSERCLIAGRWGNEQRCSQWKPASGSSEECRRVRDMWRSVATLPPVVEINAVRSSICTENDGSDGYNAPGQKTSPHRRQSRQNLASKSRR
jgi:hypothetical protein